MIHRSVRLVDPPVLLTPSLARILLARRSNLEVECQGLAWWPHPSHGERISLERYDGERDSKPLTIGELVLIRDDEGRIDLLRVADFCEGVVELVLDSDRAFRCRVDGERILARRGRSRPIERFVAAAHRFTAPIIAALLRHRHSSIVELGADPSSTVALKYDEQSDNYGGRPDHKTIPEAAELISRGDRTKPVLVGGCGTGPDVAAFSARGFRVVGVDFVLSILRYGTKRGVSNSSFAAMDLRRLGFRDGAFGAVYLTEDVYSFISGRQNRIDLLRALRSVTAPGGSLLFTARPLESTTGWIRLADYSAGRFRWRGGKFEWGDWYSSFIAGDGSLRHSFVHVFTDRAIERELLEAGWGEIARSGSVWKSSRRS